ncbi:MAG TPA: replication protein RepA [Geminicoccaceae bacterium]|nr:replication protein RepA [Geminicoccaceae bacterium]
MGRIHDAICGEGRQLAFDLVADGHDRRTVQLAAAFLACEDTETGFTHPGLCLTVLPYRALLPDQEWRRISPTITLSVQPLRDSEGRLRGVPYGTKARLILLYLQSEAVRSHSPEIELGGSMHAWLKRLGVSAGGKTYAQITEQADRIASCVLTFTYRGRDGDTHWQDSIVRGTFDPRARRGERVVRLSETFFNALRERPTPINIAAVRLLGDRCAALDIYLWLAYRLHSLKAPTAIGWPTLHAQFGANTQQVWHFKPRFVRELKAAAAVYPEARVELQESGVLLFPSAPPTPASLVVPGGPARLAKPRATRLLPG